MDDNSKIIMVQSMTGENDQGTISAYLFLARQKLCRILGTDEVPADLDGLHVEATAYLLNKRGAEGEIIHNENGINRHYENADIPGSLLLSYGIVSKCEVVS